LKRKNPEREIHRAVVQHLTNRAKKSVVWFHPANGGSRNIIEAVNLKRLGVRAGVSDLILFNTGEFFALELKAPGGRPTIEQMEFQSSFRNAGGHAVIAEGLDEAIGCLNLWGLLK
jgi:hypothetical protein